MECETPSKAKPSQIARAKEFLIEEFVNGKSLNRFKCTVCPNLKVLNGNTPSNLPKHFKQCHPKEYAEHIADKNEDSIEVQRLKTIHSCVELVSINSLPFSILSSSGFRRALEDKLRVYQLAGCELNLSDHHVLEIKEKVREVAGAIHDQIKSEVKGKIISVMVDSATRNRRSIFGINIQYRHNGTLKVVTLAMCELKESHTAKHLADVLSNVLAQYEIDLAQVLTITTDSGSNMIAMIKDIEKRLFEDDDEADLHATSNDQTENELFEPTPNVICEPTDDDELNAEKDIDHFLNEIELSVAEALDIAFDESANYGRLLENLVTNVRQRTGNHHLFVTSIKCAAHTLQLAVNDAIGLLGKNNTNAIALCRHVAKFLRLPSTKYAMQQAGLKCILPALDVNTRWSSTFRMINDMLRCENVIRHFEKKERMCELLLKKWHVLMELNRILNVPYLVTKMLQKPDFTLSDFFGCLKIIKFQLNKINAEPGKKYTRLAEHLLHTLSQRESKLVDHPLMICSLYLDPRYKCELMNDHEKVQLAKLTLENIWERMKSVKKESGDLTEGAAAAKKNDKEENMKSFFEELDQMYGSMGIDNGANDSNQDKSKLAVSFSKYETSTVHRMKSSESVWTFWQKSKHEFGNELYELAAVIHSIPPTQASVERNFSALKFMLTDRRYNLSEDLLECLLIIHLNRDFYDNVKEMEILKLKSSPHS